jgi:hypothetical protein
MIKSVYFNDKVFESKEALFKALKDNEEDIIEFKKGHVYKGVDKCVTTGQLIAESETVKGIGFRTKDGFIYPIISTTRYMDSHDDVHFDGCFNKTEREQQGRVYYCADHNLSTTGVVANKRDVRMMIKSIPWSVVGKDFEGTTQALIFEIEKSKIINEIALKLIESDPEIENSIRMLYTDVKMAINSKDKAFAENKAYFDSRIDMIANKEKAMKQGYFFGVESLKIHKEGSMVIEGGSNDATRIYQNAVSASAESNAFKIESDSTTQTEKPDYSGIYKQIKFY